MNGITLALTRFWQNKQISLPPMSTLLIAAGIMFFCFWVVTSQKQKEQEERQRMEKCLSELGCCDCSRTDL